MLIKKIKNQRILTRIIKKRTRRNIKSKKKRKIANQIKSGLIITEEKKNILKYHRLTGPEFLNFNTHINKEKIINFIQNLKRVTLKQGQPVIVNFSNSRDSEATGVLLLLAEIDRIQCIKGKKFIKGIRPNDTVASQVFHQTGLSDMLSIKGKTTVIHQEVIYWNHIHGTEINVEDAGNLIKDLAKQYELDEESRGDLYNGVTEAITNTVMHAYDAGREDNFPYCQNKWWMFTGIKEGQLTVVVCDIGIGIPRSLRVTHPSLFQKFKQLFISGDDCKLIELAMEAGRSESQKPHRGLGMTELKSFINSVGKGRLVIYSNRGGYSYQGEGRSEESSNFKHSIMGTIVGWRVPIDVFRGKQ